MFNQFWFEPKLHGYGMHPVTWEGRVLLAALVVAVIAFVVIPAIRGRPFYWGRLLAMMMIVFGVAYMKTGNS